MNIPVGTVFSKYVHTLLNEVQNIAHSCVAFNIYLQGPILSILVNLVFWNFKINRRNATNYIEVGLCTHQNHHGKISTA